MRTISTLLAILLCITMNAQVSEVKYDISLGEQNAFMMDHTDAESKMVENVIEDILDDFGKVKKNRKAKEWICEECKIPSVSFEPLRVYYKIVERRDLVTSYLFFDDGTQFLSSDNSPGKMDAIEDLCMDIFHEVKREIIRKEIEDMEDQLGGFEKDLSKLTKKNKDLRSDIESYKEKIRQAEKDIEQNLNQQQDKKLEIEKQKLTIEKTIKKLNNVGRAG